MSERKIVVPEGMLRSAGGRSPVPIREEALVIILEAAMKWLSTEVDRLHNSNTVPWQAGYNTALDDVLKMFIAPEPTIPEEIKDLLWAENTMNHNKSIIEAFQRGYRSAK